MSGDLDALQEELNQFKDKVRRDREQSRRGQATLRAVDKQQFFARNRVVQRYVNGAIVNVRCENLLRRPLGDAEGMY